jgi:hypothetical protein
MTLLWACEIVISPAFKVKIYWRKNIIYCSCLQNYFAVLNIWCIFLLVNSFLLLVSPFYFIHTSLLDALPPSALLLWADSLPYFTGLLYRPAMLEMSKTLAHTKKLAPV